MPILDDEQFERYLKEFRPLDPEPLQIEKQPGRARHPFVVMAWAAACAASLVLALLLWHRPKLSPPANTPQLATSQSLTIGRANALLLRASSLNEACDQLSFQPKPALRPEGKQSALAVLSREDSRL